MAKLPDHELEHIAISSGDIEKAVEQ